jgi:hypothetical protein
MVFLLGLEHHVFLRRNQLPHRVCRRVKRSDTDDWCGSHGMRDCALSDNPVQVVLKTGLGTARDSR